MANFINNYLLFVLSEKLKQAYKNPSDLRVLVRDSSVGMIPG